MRTLKVAILWHFHQPSYWDPRTSTYRYPWVFLHTARHYHAMGEMARAHPEMKMAFNFTPVLVRQMEHYIEHGPGDDRLLGAMLKPADDLSREDLRLVLEHAFKLHLPTMVYPFSRYRELHGLLGESSETRRKSQAQPADVRDLQVLYLLTWCGIPLRRTDPVKSLLAKGKGYTEEDKAQVFLAMSAAMRQTLPLYRELQSRGQIEVTTTPYYHPILPLLIDASSARESRPDVEIDGVDYRFPEDARWQVEAAVKYHREIFGVEPQGMWPAEGSVSDAALRLLGDCGIRWAATDEGVLGRSLGKFGVPAKEKYRPYRFSNTDVWVYFRDREMSDRIGFVYSGWDAEKGAADVIARLLAARDTLGEGSNDACYTIVLDGENPWEYYGDSGFGFLDRLYRALVETPELEPVRFCDHRREFDDAPTLSHVVPGSWIDANFDTWIGCPEKNHAWKILEASRRELEREAPDAPVPDEIYRAEGSDWFWWLGPGHDTPYEASYENLFRLNLRLGLEAAGVTPPKILDSSTPQPATRLSRPPFHLSTPRIDGRRGSYYDWIAAGYFRASEGSFHRTERFLEVVRYAFDLENLYLRLEGNLELLRNHGGESVILVEFKRPQVVDMSFSGGELAFLNGTGGNVRRSPGRAALDDVLEIQIPFASIDAEIGDWIEFSVEFAAGDNTLDRLPQSGSIAARRPGPDFGEEYWNA